MSGIRIRAAKFKLFLKSGCYWRYEVFTAQNKLILNRRVDMDRRVNISPLRHGMSNKVTAIYCIASVAVRGVLPARCSEHHRHKQNNINGTATCESFFSELLF